LRQTHNVKEVTCGKQSPLVAPGCYDLNGLFVASDCKYVGVLDCSVASELAGLVLVVKELNKFLVFFLNFVVVKARGADLSLFFVAQLNAFFRHHGHEEVAGVGQFWARIANFLKVLN